MRLAVEQIADQLCYTIDGSFDRSIDVDSEDETAQKLALLVNAVLDAARRAVLDIERQNVRALAAQRRLEKLATALEQTGDVILITDRRGRIEYVNPAFEAVTGYSRQEVLGRNARFLAARQDNPALYRQAGRVLLSGRTWKGRVKERRKDGLLIEADVTISPVLSPDGEIVNFVTVKRDVTQQHEAEARLRRAHKTLKLILQKSPFGVALIDRERRFNWVNDKVLKMMGFEDPRQVLGRHCREVLCLERKQPCPFGEERSALLSGKILENVEDHFRSRDGRKIPVLKSAMVIQLGGEELVLETFIDITERKQMERDLGQARKLEAIGQLAAGIAHEINTPTQFVGDNIRFLHDAFPDLLALAERCREVAAQLSSVPGEASATLAATLREALEAADSEYLSEEVPRAIEQALEGVDRVSKIVRAMKEFSHPSTTKTRIDLNHAIESTITVARSEWKYVADLTTDLDPELPPVPCVPAELNQTILNLLVNAAHAIADKLGEGASQKGTISISTRRVGPWAEIRITDSGTGIPEAIRERIFDPFFTTKEVGKGTGQGLAIAHNAIVGKHQGTLECESVEGQGTTFIIRLPLDTDDDGSDVVHD